MIGTQPNEDRRRGATRRILVVSSIMVGLFIFGWGAAGGLAKVRLWIHDYRSDRLVRQVLSSEWPALSAGASRLGKSTRPAQLIEFADYECPYCRVAGRKLDSLIENSDLVIGYRHLPIRDLHPAAEGAARAAICAEAQGRFPEMHRYLNSTSDWQRDSQWTVIAGVVGGIDTATFASCIPAEATTRRLSEDSAYASRLRVWGTPTFFTRAGRFMGVLTAEGTSGLHSQ
jgi:predicted DsbA family dithiol-disulfide isomerase